MISAIKVLKALGSRRIYVACVHPLLIGDSRERIMKEGASQIVGTNCVQSPVSVVSVAPLIAEALRKWFHV
jgi:ribose-phosphate pyrophosphokinase